MEIAKKCKGYVPKEKALPEFPIPNGYTNEEYLHKLAWEGMKERIDKKGIAKGFTEQDYWDRLEYEYNTICQMGFVDYHLIVQDFIQWAKDDKVYEHPEKYFPKPFFNLDEIDSKFKNKNYSILVGPGRGSAAGSILCYSLKITNLDSIRDGLLFERFLNPERISMPDIDTDFPNQYRELLIEYCQAKYGFEKVSQIVTYQMLGVKSIIKNLGKALDIPYLTTDDLSKNVPDTIRISTYLDDVHEVKEVKVTSLEQIKDMPYYQEQIKANENVAKLFEIGKLFNDLPSSTGKHACGVIIGSQALTNYLPLMDVDGVLVSQFEKKASEAIGMLKMDFLGLQTLDVETETFKLIKEVHGIDLDIEKIPEDDDRTFKLLQKGETNKVFQLESDGMKNLLKQMKPTNMSHINAIVALYRPGPMQFIGSYIKGKNNPSSVHYPHETYEEVSKETYSILVYQEQIMQLSMKFAGFSMGEADELRKAAAKKNTELMKKIKKKFIKGAISTWNVDEQFATQIFEQIEPFAEYGFNKSHSAAYARVAYETAYLKAHYPECFMAANCTINADDKKKLLPCLKEIKSLQIPLLPPNIKYSKAKFSISTNENNHLAIRYGFEGITKVGSEVSKNLGNIKETSSYFKYVYEATSKGISKSVIRSLILAGAMDHLGDRKAQVDKLETTVDYFKTIIPLQRFYNTNAVEHQLKPLKPDLTGEYNLAKKIEFEQEYINISLSGHPLDYIRPLKDSYNELITIDGINQGEVKDDEIVYLLAIISSTRKIITKKGDDMMFITINDEYGSLDGVVFPRDYENLKDIIEENVPMLITGKLQQREENGIISYSLVLNSLEKALKHDLRLYIPDNIDIGIYRELQGVNGIAAVISVNTDKFFVDTHSFYVDLKKAKNILAKHNIPYIAYE